MTNRSLCFILPSVMYLMASKNRPGSMLASEGTFSLRSTLNVPRLRRLSISVLRERRISGDWARESDLVCISVMKTS